MLQTPKFVQLKKDEKRRVTFDSYYYGMRDPKTLLIKPVLWNS